jgi:two-component system OmpR family sensor kinase
VSLRARLLLAVGAVAIAALAVADVAIYSALHGSLFNKVDQSLQQAAAFFVRPAQQDQSLTCPLQPGSSSPPGSDGAGAAAFFNQSGHPRGPGFPAPFVSSYFVALGAAGSSVSAAGECPAYVGGHTYAPRLPAKFTGFSAGPGGTQVTYFTAPADEKGGPDFQVRVAVLPNRRELIVGAPVNDTESTLHRLLLIELGVSAIAVVFALAAGWWLVRLGLRPLTEVERTAENIAAGDLRHRVPDENDRTEVGRLAKALNVMLGRIESAFTARVASEERLKASERSLRQFVGDASHELRTPIAAVSAYAELFERGAADNEEDLARVMQGIRSETARMDRLVADLLTLARLDEGQPIEHVPVELVTVCAEAVQTARTVAPGWPLKLSATRPVEVEGDPHRLRQVLDNLLANVRSHTPPGTEAEVRVGSAGDQAVVVVADRGPGMAEDGASRVFERFFRSDPSRSRSHGGAGLGLSIVDAIVEAHGGSVAAESAPGRGMTITVRLPLVPLTEPEPDDGPGGLSQALS